MQAKRMRAVATVFAFGTFLFGTAQAQTPAPKSAASNELQRAVQVVGYTAAAKSGAARGEVLYYYKCWNCHNDYTRAAGSPAPTPKDIFNSTTLVTGAP